MNKAAKTIFAKRHGATRFDLISEELGYYIVYCDQEISAGKIAKTMKDTGYEVRSFGKSDTLGHYMTVKEIEE